MVEHIEEYCKKDKQFIFDIRKKYAFILRDYALTRDSAISKIHFLNLSTSYFKKVKLYKEIDTNKIELSYIDIYSELNSFEIKLPSHFIKHLNKIIHKKCISIQEADNILKIFLSVFNLEYGFKDEELDTHKPSNLYMLFSTLAFHPGRTFIVEDSNKNEYWKYELYEVFLDMLQYPLLSSSIECLNEIIYLNYWIEIISNERNFVEKERINLFYKIVMYYLQHDFVAFMYSIIPQIEYIIKKVLQLNNCNVTNREIEKNETKSLNIRNALLHGEYIYLHQKIYADWLLYIFVVILLYGRKLESET